MMQDECQWLSSQVKLDKRFKLIDFKAGRIESTREEINKKVDISSSGRNIVFPAFGGDAKTRHSAV